MDIYEEQQCKRRQEAGPGEGGGGSVWVYDSIDLGSLGITEMSFNMQEFSTSNPANTLDAIGGAFCKSMDDKSIRKMIAGSPKVAVGVTAVGLLAVAVSALADHSTEVDKMVARQANVINQLNAIVEGYTEGCA